MLKGFPDLHVEVEEFLQLKNKENWVALFKIIPGFSPSLIDDTFNLSLQGKGNYIMDFVDKRTAFISMLEMWTRINEDGRMGIFPCGKNFI